MDLGFVHSYDRESAYSVSFIQHYTPHPILRHTVAEAITEFPI